MSYEDFQRVVEERVTRRTKVAQEKAATEAKELADYVDGSKELYHELYAFRLGMSALYPEQRLQEETRIEIGKPALKTLPIFLENLLSIDLLSSEDEHLYISTRSDRSSVTVTLGTQKGTEINIRSTDNSLFWHWVERYETHVWFSAPSDEEIYKEPFRQANLSITSPLDELDVAKQVFAFTRQIVTYLNQ